MIAKVRLHYDDVPLVRDIKDTPEFIHLIENIGFERISSIHIEKSDVQDSLADSDIII
jgi:hypothetical protein